jgi:nucleoside-diphosphate-sugar epimerase
MKILVTGATGFIGFRLTERLSEQGHVVVATSRSAEAQAERFPEGVTPRDLDITLPEGMGVALAGVDVVVHAAARVGDWGAREEFFSTDVDGTRAVLEAARRAEVPRFIHVSSITVYGLEAEGPVTESSPRVDPETCPYAYTAAKSAAEAVVEAAREDGYPVIIVRPGYVYGPNSHHWTDRPATLIRKGLAGVPSDRGYSNTVYVDNVCALVETCCSHEAALGETFHVVDLGLQDWGIFFDGYAEVLGFGGKPEKKTVPRRPAGLMRTLAVVSEVASMVLRKAPLLSRYALEMLAFRGHFPMDHAETVLGWTPPVSAEEGMRRTQAYLKERYP